MHIHQFLPKKPIGEVSLEGYSQKFNLDGLQPLIAAVEYIQDRPLTQAVVDDSNISEAIKGLTNLTFVAGIYKGLACVGSPVFKNTDTLHKALLTRVGIKNIPDSTIGSKLRKDAKITFDITVDTENHWFTGPGAKELSTNIYLGTYIFGAGRLIPTTTMQCVAVILHELGHITNLILGAVETATTCAYLDDLSNEIIGANDIKTKRIIIGSDRALASSAKLLENASTKEEIIVIALNEKNKELKSKFGDNPIEYRNSEFLADGYATKWGMGKEMAQFNYLVDKYPVPTAEPFRINTTVAVAFVAAVISPLLIPILVPLALAYDVFHARGVVDATQKDIYGIEGERITSIRKSMIERLKEAPDKNAVKLELNALAEVELLLADSKVHFPIMYRLASSIFPGLSGRTRYRSAAILAEDFANAEINIHIEKLRN